MFEYEAISLMNIAMFPADVSDEELNNSEDIDDEEFVDFRREASDCIEYVYGVAGSSILNVLGRGLTGTPSITIFIIFLFVVYTNYHKIRIGECVKQLFTDYQQ